MHQTVISLLEDRRRSDRRLYIVALAAALCLAPLLAVAGAVIGYRALLASFALLVLAAVVTRWPLAGLYAIVTGALLVESAAPPIPGSTPTLYIFYWPPSFEGQIERPIGFFIIFIFFVLIGHNLAARRKALRGGTLLWPFVLYLLCVAWGVVHGLAGGGNAKIIVEEVRPFLYCFEAYLLAYNLVRTRQHVYNFFWLVVVCAGIKGIQGVYIYIVLLHGSLINAHEIMAHEESFFFVGSILLTILFLLHHRYRPQFRTALAFLPFVLIALIANQRRTDYVALLVGMAVAWILIYMIKPRARRSLTIIMLVALVLGSAYVAAFAHGSGGLSEPARAVLTVLHPDPNDASAQYRAIENTDLKYTVRLNPLGLGFGRPFLQPIPLPNIQTVDPVYNFIPHNTIYWVWMRLGPVGYGALWYLLGAIIIRGCIIARRLDDAYLQLAAIYVVAMTIMQVIVAYSDYQLYFFRNVIYIGLLAGVLMKLPEVAHSKEASGGEYPRRSADRAVADLGRRRP